MKISVVFGFLLPVPALRGGATEKTWHRLSLQFAAAGHEVTVVSRRWPGLADRERRDGASYLRIPGADHSRWLPLNLIQDARWGRRAARALPPGDVVISHSVSLPLWLPRLNPAAGRVAAVLGRVPKGQTRFYGGAARLYATSRYVAERIAADLPGRRDRIKLVWYPIDCALQASAIGRRDDGPVEIGYIGRLHPEKGIDLLLRAAAALARMPRLPDWRLSLTGPVTVPQGGGGEEWVRRRREEFGPVLGDRLRIQPPEFDPGRLAARYGALHVFCYPSLAERGETFGVAVAEAMAAGCAPVVSDLRCFQDLVSDGDNGAVFDHRAPDADARLAAILAGLVRDGARRRLLGGRARDHVARFDYAQIGANILADLSGLVQSDR